MKSRNTEYGTDLARNEFLVDNFKAHLLLLHQVKGMELSLQSEYECVARDGQQFGCIVSS